MLRRFYVAMTLTAGLCACGDTVQSNLEPAAIATLRGQVTNPQQLAIPSHVKIALIWINIRGEKEKLGFVAQETPLRAEFPFRFELSVTALPPEQVIFSPKDFAEITGETSSEMDEDSSIAMGVPLVYEDVNGNGQVDQDTEAGASTDRVLGTYQGGVIMYVQRAQHAMTSPEITSGFHVFFDDPQGGDEPQFKRFEDTEIVIGLENNPSLGFFLCQSVSLALKDGPIDFKNPPAEVEKWTCAKDGYALDVLICPFRPLCDRGCTTVPLVLDKSQPLPPNWPCPVP